MKFENKGKWFGESARRFKEEDLTNDEMLALDEDDDFSDLVADDELDLAVSDEQPMNEVRYIDPANLDRYNKDEIEEVIKADGTKAYKRKDTSASATKNLKLKQEKPKVFDTIQDIDPSKPLYKQKDYQYILNNLPRDPHAREAAFIQMGNKYKDPEQRRKNVWVALSQSNSDDVNAMGRAMGLNIDNMGIKEKLDAMVDAMDFD